MLINNVVPLFIIIIFKKKCNSVPIIIIITNDKFDQIDYSLTLSSEPKGLRSVR